MTIKINNDKKLYEAEQRKLGREAEIRWYSPQQAWVTVFLRWDKSVYGFSTTLPNIWLFSMYSCAARTSFRAKLRSTTGFNRPAKTWPSASYSSPIVPM